MQQAVRARFQQRSNEQEQLGTSLFSAIRPNRSDLARLHSRRETHSRIVQKPGLDSDLFEPQLIRPTDAKATLARASVRREISLK